MALCHPDLSQAIWRKSTYSSSTGQNCVEVATNLPDIIAVRDSKDLHGAKLLVSPGAWQSLVHNLKDSNPAF
jgi:Domain of unknown function (DUF397)